MSQQEHKGQVPPSDAAPAALSEPKDSAQPQVAADEPALAPPSDQKQVPQAASNVVVIDEIPANEPQQAQDLPKPQTPVELNQSAQKARKVKPSREADEANGNDEEDREDDEAGKSVRRGSSQEIPESREEENENDTSQPITGGSKKCFNKLCTSKKIFKKIRSKVEQARYRFLCKNCYENYVNNNFCEYCEQIYSNFDEDEDQDKWVGCDQCERWNHVECEKKMRNPNYVFNREAVDEPYECLACAKKNHNGTADPQSVKKKTVADKEPEPARIPRIAQIKPDINEKDRIPIFHKKPQNFPCLEPFLQSYNFRLWLTESLIREDLDSLRSLARRPGVEEEPKKSKKVKLD